MFYEKNKSEKLDKELFLKPTKEYRGTPFWAWNCVLNKNTLKKQISYLKEMGFGGFHMHSRTGMATEYLSYEFFDFVKFCVDEAKKQGMLAWLYDEDRWPSGTAGGLVTKDVTLRGKRLLITPFKCNNAKERKEAIKDGSPYLIAVYDIILNKDCTLKEYKKIEENDAASGMKRYAYILTNENTPWYNNQAYVDTLSKRAIDKFIELTYEGYKKAVGDEFGKTIPAIFTDEPQFTLRTFLKYSNSDDEAEIPWTQDLEKIIKERKHFDILDYIPELFWEKSGKEPSFARYDFTDCISEIFTENFMDNCGMWCRENGIYMTGHMMLEPTLELQSWGVGDIMRTYRNFTLPGIDILCERMEYSTAKQAQSIVHQFGREGMLSELYGVTNWDYDFRGHKFQGDWQAALGVTVRVPHLSWMSMEGEAKRDYPSTFNYQSPWYSEYSLIENHYARVATALTRGKPIVKIGVIHPVETYWIHNGPKDLTSDYCLYLDEKFKNIVEWLLFNHLDFDFISESLLPMQSNESKNPLKVGEMSYDVVIIPSCETLRDTTVDILNDFKENGGKVIFMGKCPNMINGRLSSGAEDLYNKSTQIDFDKVQLLNALKDEKLIKITNDDGLTANNLLYNLREDNDCNWLFIAQGKKQWEHNPVQLEIAVQHDCVKPQNIKIEIKGHFYPSLYDTMSGEVTGIKYVHTDSNTIIYRTIYENDSLLIKLSYEDNAPKYKEPETTETISIYDIRQVINYELEEENVYLLDCAEEYSLDGKKQGEKEELLRVDNALREKLSWPLRQKKIAQPWSVKQEDAKHFVSFKFIVNSKISAENIVLALEKAEKITVLWNKIPVKTESIGYFADESIKKINLGKLNVGQNTLEVTAPYTESGSIEWMYLLGDFGVMLRGTDKTIVKKYEKIGFGDISRQLMPFYGGNIVYDTDIDVPKCDYTTIQLNAYRGMFVKVFVDGEETGNIVFAPQILKLKLSEGKHNIKFKLFGNRHNTFAAIHNFDNSTYYHGPNSWRTEGVAWGYEYNLKDFGIIKSPIFKFEKIKNIGE